MKWSGSFKMVQITPVITQEFDLLMQHIVEETAKYFIQGLTSHVLIPAWTGQARASLTHAALLVGVNIDYSDVIEKDRKGKSVQTGINQGSAKFYNTKSEYGFQFRSWVTDLNKRTGINYLLENEEEATHANRVRETPWHSLDEAGEHTEIYIQEEIFPFVRRYLKKDLLLVSYVNI